MTALYLGAIVAVALSLSAFMAIAWVVQHRTGNSGWVDTIWTFSVGLVRGGKRSGRSRPRRRTRGNGWLQPLILLAGIAGEALADAQLVSQYRMRVGPSSVPPI